MAHFAEIDSTNTVLRVVVINNDDVGDLPFPESEPLGINFCRTLFGENTQWLQTSYNGNFRKNYAGIWFTYDIARDAFIPPYPGEGWTLDEATCQWVAPPEQPEP
jgi:hypothetical protein